VLKTLKATMPTIEEEAQVRNRQGIAFAQQGRFDEAAAWFRDAIRVHPHAPAAHNNLANILSFQGRFADAVASYRIALSLVPNDPATLNNLGNALRQMGENAEAIQYCRRSLALQPDFCEAHSNLSLALEAQGELNDALHHAQVAIQLRPDFPAAYANLSIVLRELGRIDEGIAACEQALRLNPQHAEAHSNLGALLLKQDRWHEAAAHLRKALQLKPDLLDARISLASCCWHHDQLDEARQHCVEALRQRPKLAAAHNVLGAVLHKQGLLQESLAAFDEALRLEPNLAEAHFNRAMVVLTLGKFDEGWQEYEWRWKCKHFVIRQAERAPWDGSPLAGKTILLLAEQGMGDTLQFIRYAPMVKALGATVVMACAASLVRLLGRCPGIDRVVSRDGDMPDCDTHVPLLNLPSRFRTTLATIPSQVPYVFADEKLIEEWRRKLAGLTGFKIGIAWQGNKLHPFDRFRSMALETFAPLALPGVQLINLQKGPGTEQIAALAGRFAVTDLGPLDESAGAFMDTAAVMKNLNLIITSDTATAHLAGALSVPVWVALPAVPDWRWLLDRADSPWYPTMRLFRQTALGRWDDVFTKMAQELARLINERATCTSVPIEIAPSELIDKITILEIKRERIADQAKVANVRTELDMLSAARDRAIRTSPPLDVLTAELKKTNEALWQIEDAIRVCERNHDFGPTFVELARSVYRDNDRRADLKRQINTLLGSKLIEEKSYAEPRIQQ
jgi:tetratricopeptide (TPR) repeat protein/post-segregation antitoxin (ccd killing protein)